MCFGVSRLLVETGWPSIHSEAPRLAVVRPRAYRFEELSRFLAKRGERVLRTLGAWGVQRDLFQGGIDRLHPRRSSNDDNDDDSTHS